MNEQGRNLGADLLLDDLLARPPEERRAALAATPNLDPSLRGRLEAVLGEAEANDAFLSPQQFADRPLLRDLDVTLADESDSLRPGTRFTDYEVLALAGRGGMGEVYRARDSRLARDVALKMLPADVSHDPERRARLDREARLLASLNHPNIAAIYGLANSEGREALVLEFVEGETLADRLSRGAMRVSDAVGAARQLALALDAAHQRGIVHRDLKPANIKLTADGTLKVLDFGLARARDGDADGSPSPVGLTTEWRPHGRVFGTPAYMSPEQALGQPVDARTDIWAFGCVLFEMLTASRAFGGANAQEVMARVIEREPDFARLPVDTPQALQRLVRRALVKDPKRRLASMADALLEIDDASSGASVRTLSRARLLGMGIGIVALLALSGLLWWKRPFPASAPRIGVRLALPIPASDVLLVSSQQVAALAPDGKTVVYRAVRDGNVRLFARSLDSMVSRPIAGTENAAGPFFSPDGAWLGFDGDGVLQKVSLLGGSPVEICAAPGGANASWGGSTIVFSTNTGKVLQVVSAGGGVPERLTTLDPSRGDTSHGFPHVMPRGDAVLFTIVTPTDKFVAAVRFDTREVSVLTPGSQPRYLPSGHLLFVRNDGLWAAPFSDAQLGLLGEPKPVLEGLELAGGSAAHFGVGADGTLMYVPRREEVRGRSLAWIDRNGGETVLAFPPGLYNRAALSPDGTRVAVALAENGDTDIWVAGAGDRSWVRVTREPGIDTAPLWSADGRSIVFRSERKGGGLFRADVDGVGEAVRLTRSLGTMHTPHGWTPDGKLLLFTELRSYTEQSMASLNPDTGDVQHLLRGAFAQLRPHVSPDGRWIAYQSDESGRFEIYVRPYPAMKAGLFKVSASGGTSPRWTQHGRELVYYDGRAFVSVAVGDAPRFVPGQPTKLFDYAPYSGRMGPDYDVTTDGRRFLVVRGGEDSPGSRAQLVLIERWIDEMRDRLAK